jgi:hypothetical protein
MPSGKLRQQHLRQRIAAAAARMMAEDGIEDFAHAKRKAARQLGAIDSQSLPNNDEVEEQLRAYQSLYQGDEQRDRLVQLRRLALEVMRLLEPFRPYLTGPVLKGTVARYGDIDLQVFTDDPKSVELLLLGKDIAYEADQQRHFAGDQARTVPVLRFDWEATPINVAVFPANDERNSLKTSPVGRAIERAPAQAVARLVGDDD